MKPTRKTLLFVLALAIGLVITGALVRAASPGEDFSWLSVSEGGIVVGLPGSAGEGEGEGESEYIEPPPHTMVFAPVPEPEGEEEAGMNTVAFVNGGLVGSIGLGVALDAVLMLLPEGSSPTGNAMAALTAEDAGIASGTFDESSNFTRKASVMCTSTGDVIVQLGEPTTGEGEGEGEGENGAKMFTGQKSLESAAANSENSILREFEEVIAGLPDIFHVPWPPALSPSEVTVP